MKRLTKMLPWSETPRRNSRCVAENRAHFDCIDCGVNTHDIREYYMVTDKVWDSVVISRKKIFKSGTYTLDGKLSKVDLIMKESGMLCVKCLETRLGRKLTHDDFMDVPVNTWPDVQRSRRLQMRMMA